MSITAKVEDGKIVLPAHIQWPDGATVRVELSTTTNVGELLADFDGIADDLPADLAANLDHYLHGHPREQP